MWLPIIITLVVGYFLGNINGSILVSKLIVHDDVRKHGSGNAGLTNFFRSYGGWNTLLVAVIDIGKAVAACLIGGFLLKGYMKEGQMLGGIFLGALAIFMHRANLMRLIKGTESKVYLTKKGRNK